MQSIISYLSGFETIEIIGQIFGLLGIICVILMPQFKKKVTINIFYFLTNVFSFLNIICLDGFGSAAYLFIVVFIQIGFSLYHEYKNQKANMIENIIFAALYLIAGLIGFISNLKTNGSDMSTWDICLQIIPIIGAEFAMLLVATPKPQHARIYQICNSSLWAIYYGFIGSVMLIAQFIAIISSAIGFLRDKND